MKRFKYMALAALVAFAACDEGTDVVVTPPVTGDIAGVVTIEGTAVSGVTVALSSGATTTTDGSGAYSFSDVAAGAYTITISGFAADATFSSTSKAATIVTTGQVATVNFDGAYVRTSAILGSVAAGGAGLPGVNVSIGSSTTQTDANGQYSFSGLRAGTYTVTVSGFDAQHYAFATSTQNVTVGVGESKVISFNGQLLATATISGTMYIDGNTNANMDAGEPAVMTAGITIGLERAIGDTIYTTTDANGAYSFADLEEGTYKVLLDGTQAGLPGAFSQSGDGRYLAVATSGAATTVNFPFVVTTQYVQVYGMLGRDGVNVGVAPIKNWTMVLYPTDVDARKNTNKISTGTIKTDANGMSVFKFLRANDYSPNANAVDGIVFAKVPAAPGAGYAINGENIIEIPWMAMDSMVMAPDTFDATYNTMVAKVHVNEIDADTLAGWTLQVRVGADTTIAITSTVATDANGDAYLNMAGLPSQYPYTAFVRLAGGGQPDGGHGWGQTPNNGTAHGRFLKMTWDGTVLPTDTVFAGIESVKYTDSDIVVQVHHEQDDTMGFTAGDALGLGALGVAVDLRKVTTSGTTLTASGTAVSGVGTVTFAAQAVASSWQVRARALSGAFVLLNDTSVAVTLDGSDQSYTVPTLKGSAGASTFMVKTNNNTLSGRVQSRYGATNVPGLVVTMTPTAMNIQGSATTKDTTLAGGFYSFAGVREGPYTITVEAGDSAYTFLRTLKKTPVPAASAINSDGLAATTDNDSPTQGTRDVEGTGVTQVTNFEAYRNDTKFAGLVVNDRDTDLTTVDPGEALAGAIINLYRDDDAGSAGTDTLTASDTTDANGAYSFTGLLEGRYTAVWASGTPNTDVSVLTKLSTAGTATTKVSATPLMGANVVAAGNLPAWNYADPSTPSNLAPANFTFLYSNTVVQGTITASAAVGSFAIGDPVPGMSVTLQKCFASTANTGGGNTLTNVSGPQPDTGVGFSTCTTFFAGSTTIATDSDGKYQFAGLREGVYRVTPAPGTVPTFATFVGTATGFASPANDNQSGLFLTVGSGDIETLNFNVF